MFGLDLGASAGTDSAHQSYRVLLVSANELVRFSLENFFKDSNVAISEALNNEDGEKLLKKE